MRIYSIILSIMNIETHSNLVSKTLSTASWHSADTVLKAIGETQISKRSLLRILHEILGPTVTSLEDVRGARGDGLNSVLVPHFYSWLKSKRYQSRIIQLTKAGYLVLSDFRGHLEIFPMQEGSGLSEIESALNQIDERRMLIPHGTLQGTLQEARLGENLEVLDFAHKALDFQPKPNNRKLKSTHTHLLDLEQESIYIIREAVAVAERPAMLFSLGKDSMAMLKLAEKAFSPGPIPFPLVNIDTRWKFQEMNKFREWIKARTDFETIHYINPDAIEGNTNPFDHGSAVHTDITKTQALKKVLDLHRFDFVFGGARRDEEKSRAKERIFSIRNAQHGWDPKNQRPELWDIYNTTLVQNQSMRVFPLSNWTELDIWRYLEQEDVPLVPLYFAKRRPFVERNGSLIMIDDDRFRLEDHEKVDFDFIRFRSLGCYPLSGGVRSNAKSVSDIVKELESTRVSERSSRVIDFDRGASMEQKKKEGYF